MEYDDGSEFGYPQSEPAFRCDASDIFVSGRDDAFEASSNVTVRTYPLPYRRIPNIYEESEMGCSVSERSNLTLTKAKKRRLRKRRIAAKISEQQTIEETESSPTTPSGDASTDAPALPASSSDVTISESSTLKKSVFRIVLPILLFVVVYWQSGVTSSDDRSLTDFMVRWFHFTVILLGYTAVSLMWWRPFVTFEADGGCVSNETTWNSHWTRREANTGLDLSDKDLTTFTLSLWELKATWQDLYQVRVTYADTLCIGLFLSNFGLLFYFVFPAFLSHFALGVGSLMMSIFPSRVIGDLVSDPTKKNVRSELGYDFLCWGGPIILASLLLRFAWYLDQATAFLRHQP
eukprot:TRINITY_DN16553_c0_g1_i1.p1 TRINITY_DN16553_c0_g1~~TRINITY_DN16553_c0_g1_i1.p1  ORF type:complete len:360 (+),score=50.04 TRINITY_DN16553_c0_g1_i1:37-1080(+)